MNIESTNVNRTRDAQSSSRFAAANNNDSSVKFEDELKSGKEVEDTQKVQKTEEKQNEQETTEIKEEQEQLSEDDNSDVAVSELDKAVDGLNSVVKEFNQSEDKKLDAVKNDDDFDDNKNMINNDINIQENKDLLPQMNPNMNFSGNGQPFSSFMNNSENQNSSSTLKSSAQDLAEEAAIMSTMAENIAMANKNRALDDTRTISNEDGVKRVDAKTGIKIENIVKLDSILMNEADVEVFASLVEKGEVNLNNLAPKAAEKSVQVSKTLADLLAKSMENNQPVRINFDNNISVIIRISRDGKISADFLPSSQVAEAYLKENLPLLKQRFDENNIDYESLNQRERKDNNREHNRKKDRSNE